MEKQLTKKKLENLLNKIAKETKSDIFLFSAEISEQTADSFIEKVKARQKLNENCILILTTFGGEPDSAYRIARFVKEKYKKFTLTCFGYCKSAGTLIAVAADEIIMGDFGELGPFDIQLPRDDEFSHIPGLSYTQGLLFLNEHLYRTFEFIFDNLQRDYGWTTKTAAEVSSSLAIGLMSPISAKLDPIKLGEVKRDLEITSQYGVSLSNDNKDLVRRLVSGYPSHSYVIDRNEAEDMFSNSDTEVRDLNGNETNLEQYLLSITRTQSNLIEDLLSKPLELPLQSNEEDVSLSDKTTDNEKDS